MFYSVQTFYESNGVRWVKTETIESELSLEALFLKYPDSIIVNAGHSANEGDRLEIADVTHPAILVDSLPRVRSMNHEFSVMDEMMPQAGVPQSGFWNGLTNVVNAVTSSITSIRRTELPMSNAGSIQTTTQTVSNAVLGLVGLAIVVLVIVLIKK